MSDGQAAVRYNDEVPTLPASDGERAARRAVARATRRMRYRAALRRLSAVLPLPLGYACLALATLKLFGPRPGWERVVIIGGVITGAAALLLTLLALVRKPPRWASALALDEHHGLFDRVTSALSLLESKETQEPLARAAIDDGLAVAKRLNPRKAVPLQIPREFLVSAALLATLGGIVALELQSERVLPEPPSFEPLVLSNDDLELFSEAAKQLGDRSQDPEAAAAVRKFNAFIEDIAAKRLDRAAAFERLGELEAELAESAELDREARELGLEGLSRELQKSPLSKPAAAALEQKRLADAQQALKQLAERLQDKRRPPSRAELDRLRGAIESASKASSERLSALENRRRELQEEKKSLLNRKKESGKSDAEAAKLEENKRKLERLERDQARAEKAAKELSELDRELAKAAEDLRRQNPDAAEDIRRTAEELSKIEKNELSEQEKRKLLQRLREMKELMRQQGKADSERQRQMRRFGRKARGGQGEEGDQQQGQGRGSGKAGRTTQVEVVPVPRLTQRTTPGGGGEARSEGQAGGDKPGGKGDGAGKSAGKGHDANIAGDPTELKGETQAVSAAAVDTGEGSASAEVIHGAAEGGFVGKPYKDIYVDYQSVAEQSLEHDQIPPGYRFYVRRYFQLIRPRE